MGHSDSGLEVVVFGAPVAVLTYDAAGRLPAVAREGRPPSCAPGGCVCSQASMAS
jgi:hypothetical protein